MMFRHERDGLTWIYLEHPTNEEVHEIATTLGLGERIRDELKTPTPRSLVFNEEDASFLSLHLPTKGNDGMAIAQEIDIVVGKKYVITTAYEAVAPLLELQRVLEADTSLDARSYTTEALTELVIKYLLLSVRNYIDHTAERLTRVEHTFFTEENQETIRYLSLISREFLHSESTLSGQEIALSTFLESLKNKNRLGSAFENRANRIAAEYAQLLYLVRTHRAVATELRETHAGLITADQNNIMRTLTVVTFILLPLNLIITMFGFNLHGTPLVKHPQAFWFVSFIMVLVTAGLVWYFRKKRWL
jgi:magnesium transporter